MDYFNLIAALVVGLVLTFVFLKLISLLEKKLWTAVLRLSAKFKSQPKEITKTAQDNLNKTFFRKTVFNFFRICATLVLLSMLGTFFLVLVVGTSFGVAPPLLARQLLALVGIFFFSLPPWYFIWESALLKIWLRSQKEREVFQAALNLYWGPAHDYKKLNLIFLLLGLSLIIVCLALYLF